MAIVAVCRLAILKRMPATPLTLLMAHRLREQLQSASPEKWKDEDLGWFLKLVVGSSPPSSLSEEFESSTETDFIPEPRSETSKYGRKGRDYYVSWEKIVF